ncbi:NAD(P)-binding protein [Rhizoclosmatium globosum]|uniref:NAD(P)-binding protein n=1 Tax=Rhizoclosmatium globosum TaxID=329046 RepID=A0A1Y2BWJ7_9FUNG|nr:NAD(P)-binding protein [Rhizoclosmatium globosum]|eukprot:ORY39034.1 NAD(P)-binding protein [Rhizoclosmatium globosum]
MSKTVVITGTSRGIGRALAENYIARGWNVIATARTVDALATLNAHQKLALDVSSEESIKTFATALGNTPVHLLINNAGIGGADSLGTLTQGELVRFQITNAAGPLLVTQALLHNLKIAAASNLDKNPVVVVNISSQLGSIKDVDVFGATEIGGSFAYPASKTALNYYSKALSYALKNDAISVIPMCPGHVETDMGGVGAPLKVHESVAGITENIERALVDKELTMSGVYINYANQKLSCQQPVPQREHMYERMDPRVKAFDEYIKANFKNPAALKSFKSKFWLSQLENTGDFAKYVTSTMGGTVQYFADLRHIGNKTTLETICDGQVNPAFTNPKATDAELLATLQSFTIQPPFTDWSLGGPVADNFWAYQSCNQHGYFQTGQPLKSGVTKKNDSIPASIKKEVTYWGGLNIEQDNILWVNGQYDPWHWLSNYDVAYEGQVPLLYANATHCNDLWGPTSKWPVASDAYSKSFWDQIFATYDKWILG